MSWEYLVIRSSDSFLLKYLTIYIIVTWTFYKSLIFWSFESFNKESSPLYEIKLLYYFSHWNLNSIAWLLMSIKSLCISKIFTFLFFVNIIQCHFTFQMPQFPHYYASDNSIIIIQLKTLISPVRILSKILVLKHCCT